MTLNLTGKVSKFGGPADKGMAWDEGLAWIYKESDAPHLFLAQPPIDPATGNVCNLGRQLNPKVYYFACRFYPEGDSEAKAEQRPILLTEMGLIHSPKTGKSIKAYAADWGPNVKTDRVCDVSPAVLEALGITTDDIVTVTWPITERIPAPIPYNTIVISSGHSKYCRGASCLPEGLDEVDEARKIVDRTADLLRDRGVDVITFHDDVSKKQQECLDRIIGFHNSKKRDLDVSVHLNAFEYTPNYMGVEVCWVKQHDLAKKVSAAIASCGFHDRGPKERKDLAFLNQTTMPAILIETLFCDSMADCDVYRANFEAICGSIADTLGGPDEEKLELAKLNRGETQ